MAISMSSMSFLKLPRSFSNLRFFSIMAALSFSAVTSWFWAVDRSDSSCDFWVWALARSDW